LAQAGADLVIFSGSKDLRGPQTSGLMVGRAALVSSAMAQTAPHEHVVGRPLKAGKEVVAGVVAAVEQYLAEDESARFAEWNRIAAYLVAELEEKVGLRLRQFAPSQPSIQPACIPRVGIRFEAGAAQTALKLKHALWKGEPPIAVEVVRDELWLNTHTLTMAEAKIIVERIAILL
jgi:L-seryl-tRNA(Ser) seleniumtransferase